MWKYTYTNELYHHGVKGQKWGVRRYQNYDGTLIRGAKKTRPTIDDHNAKDNNSELTKRLVVTVANPTPLNMALTAFRMIQAGKASRLENKYKKERANNPVDKHTGLRLKTKEFTPEEDAKRVNPGVKNFNTNTKNNCMLCTTAYDMRRRGYDVQAKKASIGYYTDHVKKWYKNAKVTDLKYKYNLGFKESKRRIEEVVSTVAKQGEGARGNMMITWKHSYGGHSVAYEVNKGKVRIVDAQINKIYDDSSKFLKNTWGDISICRYDNIRIDPKGIKEACE